MIMANVIKIDDIEAENEEIAWHLFNAHVYEQTQSYITVCIEISLDGIRQDIMIKLDKNGFTEYGNAMLNKDDDIGLFICTSNEYSLMKNFDEFKRDVAFLVGSAIKIAREISVTV